VKRLGKPATGDSFVLKSLSGNSAVASTLSWANPALTTAEVDYGQDVSALINGNLASGRGLAVSINSSALSLDLILAQAFATNPTATNSTFYITGGGALFQLGQDVTALQQSNVGVRSVAASSLGGTLISGTQEYLSSLKSGQQYSISNSVNRRDFTGANDILQTAIDEISILRGRIGAFERNVLQTNTRSLQSALENLTASSSAIRDADFASETSNLTRAQVLSSSGTSVLSLANQQANSVLQLLGR
jgi:flagellin